MTVLLYILGLIIGAAVFFYLYSTYQSGKDAVKKIIKKNGKEPVPTVSPNELAYRKHYLKRAPGERMCPLCGTILTKYDALYAARTDSPAGEKILIYGCRHCYKEEKESGGETKI